MSNLSFTTQPADLVVPTPLPGQAIVVSGALLAQVDQLYVDMTQAPAITDQLSMDAVRVVMKNANALKNKVEGARGASKAPYLQVGKAIDAAAESVAVRLQAVVTECKTQIEDFMQAQERQRVEIERQRREAEEKALAEHQKALAADTTTRLTAPLPMMVPLPAAPVVAPLMTHRKMVIVDASLIPDEYYVLDEVRLRRDALKPGANIPGVKVVEEMGVVAR